MTLFFLLWIFISKTKMANIILTEKQLASITKNFADKDKKNKSNSETIDNGLVYMTEIFGGSLKVNVKSQNKK
jgi:hypothetical protein